MGKDLISRREATQTTLEFIVEYLGGAFDEDFQKKLKNRLEALPSAQPEREYMMEEFMLGQDMGNPEDGSL